MVSCEREREGAGLGGIRRRSDGAWKWEIKTRSFDRREINEFKKGFGRGFEI